MNILEQIIIQKKEEVARQKAVVSLSALEKRIKEQEYRVKRSMKQALEQSSSGIIAEFKRKSPSKGWIFEKADVSGITTGYETAGASSISVLTDDLFFGGSFDDFKTARAAVRIPILRKDFIIDEYQLYQSKAMGADVILLIAAALSQKESENLSALARELELEVLLEIHNEQELEYIRDNVTIVGINNRDLNTFITDVQSSFILGEKVPGNYLKISESGISDPHTVIELRKAGFKGFLMGENFMKTENPASTLERFIETVSAIKVK